VQELAAVLASMIEIRDQAQDENELLTKKCEFLNLSPMKILNLNTPNTPFCRVSSLEEALALANRAGFQHQMGFKQ
jgi:hypothetical protein